MNEIVSALLGIFLTFIPTDSNVVKRKDPCQVIVTPPRTTADSLERDFKYVSEKADRMYNEYKNRD